MVDGEPAWLALAQPEHLPPGVGWGSHGKTLARWRRIMQLLHTDGQVEVRRLAEDFEVSVVTIRRDLETL